MENSSIINPTDFYEKAKRELPRLYMEENKLKHGSG
jgi:hypothetical protein